VWATTDAAQLAPQARQIVEQSANQFVIASVSIWEIALKVKRGKLELGTPVADYVDRLARVGNLQIIDVTPRIWLRNVALDWAHRDPADRTIVATAELEGLAIVTRDDRILSFYPHTIVA
jgi:PIN domain nuclease of toxin-antitoxin system